MTNKISGKLIILFLVLTLGLAPMLSYAKDNGNKKERARENQRENEQMEKVEKNTKYCLRAFGHLFAPGFIRNWGQRDVDWNCFLPFGISKKFSGVASSTLDTTAPIITGLSIKPNTTKVIVTWKTNEKADSTVFWSTSAGVNVNSSTTPSINKSDKTKDHKVTIEGLNAGTTYYLIVRSRDAAGNSTISSETSFITHALTSDNNPPVISSIGFLISTSTINVKWHTNENATSRVYYGTSLGLDVNASSTSFVENTTLKTNHSVSVTNLATSTVYYFAAESRDANGNRTVTPAFTATTLGL